MRPLSLIEKQEIKSIKNHLWSVYMGHEDRTTKRIANAILADAPYLRGGHEVDVKARHIGVGVYGVSLFVKET